MLFLLRSCRHEQLWSETVTILRFCDESPTCSAALAGDSEPLLCFLSPSWAAPWKDCLRLPARTWSPAGGWKEKINKNHTNMPFHHWPSQMPTDPGIVTSVVLAGCMCTAVDRVASPLWDYCWPSQMWCCWYRLHCGHQSLGHYPSDWEAGPASAQEKQTNTTLHITNGWHTHVSTVIYKMQLCPVLQQDFNMHNNITVQ